VYFLISENNLETSISEFAFGFEAKSEGVLQAPSIQVIKRE
jgi:hypothetical protein